MSGSVSTRIANQQAERVTDSGQLRLPLVLGRGAAEVERQLVAARPSRRAAARGRPRAPRARRSAWRRAVGQRGEAGAHAALGVVDRLRHRGLEVAARVQLAQPLDPGAVGGELRAQVGAALGGLAHLRDELVDRGGVEPARRRSRRPPRRASSSRRASSPGVGPADVGVVGAVGGEAELRAVVGERGRDHGDVGQVRAAAVGVVEDPGDARLVPLAARPPRRPRASRRGGRGCARPA